MVIKLYVCNTTSNIFNSLCGHVLFEKEMHEKHQKMLGDIRLTAFLITRQDDV